MHAEQFMALVVVTCTLLSVCSSHPSRIKICGSELTDALKLACGPNGYNPPYWDEDFPSTEKGAGAAAAILNRARRPRGPGVATECCHNGCTWRTIISYCADPIHGKKTKKSTDAADFGEAVYVDGAEGAQRISAAAPEMDLDKMSRSDPLFGTVSPEYLRFPRTLDEVPSPYIGMQGI